VTHIADVPHTPWCAARLERESILHLKLLPRIAGYKQVIAWAWLDMQGSRN